MTVATAYLDGRPVRLCDPVLSREAAERLLLGQIERAPARRSRAEPAGVLLWSFGADSQGCDVKFEVEAVMPSTGTGTVVARQIQPFSFVLTAGARLGGVAIKPYVAAPRAIGREGSIRSDLFAFELCSRADAPLLTVGSVVELEPGHTG